MNTMLGFFTALLPVLQTILILAGLIGGTVAGVSIFRNTKKTGIVQIQSETIVAMQAQIDALKEQNMQQQEKLDEQDFKLQAVQDAMGIAITIDGGRVIIKDTSKPDTTRHVIRRPTKKPTPGTDKKTEEGA